MNAKKTTYPEMKMKMIKLVDGGNVVLININIKHGTELN